MNERTRYTSLPGGWEGGQQKRSMVVINGVTLPIVPVGSCLLLLGGLIMWSTGMLQARSTVDGIFSDLGLAADSLEQLKASVLVSVIVMMLVTVAVLVANVWLEAGRSAEHFPAGPALAVQGYATAACRINVANWLLLLSAALAMAGSISWLTTMRAALSATEQSGSPWGKTLDTLSTHTLLTHPATAATATTASGWQLTSAATAQLTPPEPVGVRTQAAEGERDTGSGDSVLDVGQLWTYSTCPAGCVDLGVIAQVLGLPWPCFCQVWLLGDLTKELQKVVAQLWVAVTGALLLFASTSWLYGYLAAQGAHAARDVQDIMAAGQPGGIASAVGVVSGP